MKSNQKEECIKLYTEFTTFLNDLYDNKELVYDEQFIYKLKLYDFRLHILSSTDIYQAFKKIYEYVYSIYAGYKKVCNDMYPEHDIENYECEPNEDGVPEIFNYSSSNIDPDDKEKFIKAYKFYKRIRIEKLDEIIGQFCDKVENFINSY